MSVSVAHLTKALRGALSGDIGCGGARTRRWPLPRPLQPDGGSNGPLGASRPPLPDRSHGAAGSFDATAPIDGIERYYAWHRVPGFPVVAALGLSKDEALVPVRSTIRDSRIRSGLGSLALLGAALLISHLWRRHARQEKSSRRCRRRLEKLVGHFPGMAYQFLLRADGSTSMPYCSPGVRELYGAGPEGLQDSAMSIFERVHADDLDRLRDSIRTSAAQLEPWRCEFRVRGAGDRLRAGCSAKPTPSARPRATPSGTAMCTTSRTGRWPRKASRERGAPPPGGRRGPRRPVVVGPRPRPHRARRAHPRHARSTGPGFGDELRGIPRTASSRRSPTPGQRASDRSEHGSRPSRGGRFPAGNRFRALDLGSTRGSVVEADAQGRPTAPRGHLLPP